MVKRVFKRFMRDSNKFILIIMGVLLAMLPIFASVFGGVVFADYFVGLDMTMILVLFIGMILFIAFLKYIDVKKKLRIK